MGETERRDAMAKDEERGQHDERVPGPRRPYARPTLQEYGSIAKLTQSGGSTINEPANMMKAGCL